jgi:hypothetical protein
MKQPSISAQREYDEIVNNTPTTVAIPGTKKSVKLTGIKPYTIERLTKLWLSRDMAIQEDSSSALKDLCSEPYFAVKEACLFILNGYWKIRLFFPLMWRIWGKLRGYTEGQMIPIIQEGKKKLPLTAHWMNMAFSVDMRNDWMKMTTKEAKEYQAELLSEMKALSSKNSPNTEEQGDSSSAS